MVVGATDFSDPLPGKPDTELVTLLPLINSGDSCPRIDYFLFRIMRAKGSTSSQQPKNQPL